MKQIRICGKNRASSAKTVVKGMASAMPFLQLFCLLFENFFAQADFSNPLLKLIDCIKNENIHKKGIYLTDICELCIIIYTLTNAPKGGRARNRAQ